MAVEAATKTKLLNYINGEWVPSNATEYFDVHNPATGEIIGQVPFSPDSEVDAAANAAAEAFKTWRRVPTTERIQYLFKLKNLLEQHREEIVRVISIENGKTLDEARGEILRTIENVEVACGMPTMMQGTNTEDIAPGIDEHMIRQPVGVGATIVPFNFPLMIPFWYLPYALASGNTYIVKPSERTPMTMQLVFKIFEQLDLPKGVVNLVNGGKDTSNAVLDHPKIDAITFVGSTEIAKYVYGRAATNGKRVQAQGGAKNPLIILPDADMEQTAKIAADSFFGNAGQRCLAGSVAVTVGDAKGPFTDAIAELASTRIIGSGLESSTEMGPVITPQSKERIEAMIQKGIDEGGKALVDGRGASVSGLEKGNFLKPTILEGIPMGGEIHTTELFGPVMGMVHVDDVDAAIKLVNENKFGNMACLFTTSGANARKFRSEAEAGNIGINIGVAAPMAWFPFSGWKDSFFGILHAQGQHMVEFFTQTKIVIERWPKEWTRKF
jgi:malonate-semialdehyde dehydrogenase (acetylating)/methylmalonate-semialdehyde dehydrogenase